jgi:hypothetical protein
MCRCFAGQFHDAALPNMHGRHRKENVYGKKLGGFTHIEVNKDPWLFGQWIHLARLFILLPRTDPNLLSTHGTRLMNPEAIPENSLQYLARATLG